MVKELAVMSVLVSGGVYVGTLPTIVDEHTSEIQTCVLPHICRVEVPSIQTCVMPHICRN